MVVVVGRVLPGALVRDMFYEVAREGSRLHGLIGSVDDLKNILFFLQPTKVTKTMGPQKLGKCRVPKDDRLCECLIRYILVLMKLRTVFMPERGVDALARTTGLTFQVYSLPR